MKINYEGNGDRLDTFLSDYVEDISRSKIQELIKTGYVQVNGEFKKQKYILNNGDIITLEIVKEEKQNIKEWDKKELIDIISETDDYLIINKPSGLMVHPGSGNHDKTLVNILESMKSELSNIDDSRPGIVHRLDKDTSGVMIIAKNDKFHEYIQQQFENRQVEKIYLGLVEGTLDNSAGMIDAPIGRDEKVRTMMTVTSTGSKEAITIFKVVERFLNNDLVEFKLLTGRTHQIRVHAKYIGNPIYNDPVYGTTLDKENESFGQYLHAQKISFTDLNGKEVSFEAELPKVFKNKLEKAKV